MVFRDIERELYYGGAAFPELEAAVAALELDAVC